MLLVVLALLAGPIVWAHWHYDRAMADSADRLERLRRVAAQAPEYRKALDAMRAMDGRRFFLQNSAPNLAGAELQELVKAAIEGNGGRINTSQNPQPRDDGPTKQIIVSVQFFATSPALAAILYAIETQSPELNVDNITVRPLNAFRTFKPSPGQEPEVNVQMDVVGWALPEPVKARRRSRERRHQVRVAGWWEQVQRRVSCGGEIMIALFDGRPALRRTLLWAVPIGLLLIIIGIELYRQSAAGDVVSRGRDASTQPGERGGAAPVYGG